MNQCHFLGNLTREPELKEIGNGQTRVVKFGIAVNYRAKGKNEPTFIDCEAWDAGADLIAKHFTKGDPIIVHGRLRQENWTDKASGGNRSKLILRVTSFDFTPNNNRRRPTEEEMESARRADGQTDGHADDSGEDEIPF